MEDAAEVEQVPQVLARPSRARARSDTAPAPTTAAVERRRASRTAPSSRPPRPPLARSHRSSGKRCQPIVRPVPSGAAPRAPPLSRSWSTTWPDSVERRSGLERDAGDDEDRVAGGELDRQPAAESRVGLRGWSPKPRPRSVGGHAAFAAGGAPCAPALPTRCGPARPPPPSGCRRALGRGVEWRGSTCAARPASCRRRWRAARPLLVRPRSRRARTSGWHLAAVSASTRLAPAHRRARGRRSPAVAPADHRRRRLERPPRPAPRPPRRWPPASTAPRRAAALRSGRRRSRSRPRASAQLRATRRSPTPR